MKASYFGHVRYLSEVDIPQGWPAPPAYYDRDLGHKSYEQSLELYALADQLGFDWASFSEHHYSEGSLAPQPVVIAAAVARSTQRIKLAILGHVLPLNNPVRVAEELAMLDNLSDGRLVVGLLRGTPNEYLTYSVNPGETRGQAQEGMELILKAWTEPQPFSWEGRQYQYRTVSVWPRPLQAPLPPIYVLGASRETGEFAARHHLGIGVGFAPYTRVAEAARFYVEQCRANGWEPQPDQIIYRGTAYVAETDEQALADVQQLWARGEGINLDPRATVRAAIIQADPTRKKAAEETAGVQLGSTFRDRLNFMGSPETVLKQAQECQQMLGAGVLDLSFQGNALSFEKTVQSMELFATNVLPRLHEL